MSIKPKHTLEYILFQGIGFFVRLLPMKLLHETGFAIARCFYPLLKSRRNVALRNLHNAFPELDETQRDQIALRSFQSVSTAFLELLWLRNLTKEKIKQRVYIENIEVLDHLRQGNHGVILLTAHFGNWELAVQAIAAYTEITTFAVAKKQSNIFVDELITSWREMFGVKIIPMDGVRDILRALQQKGIVALAADQAAAKESVAVEFFGRDVPTFKGPAVFSLKTGSPIVLGCAVRQLDGNYAMRLVPVPSDDLVGDSDENIFELTRRQVKMTEEIIRQYPDQWMWMHKRWKHVPDRVEIL